MFASTLERNSDYAEAAKWFYKAAESGNGDSTLSLARMLCEGRGLQRDLDLALQFLHPLCFGSDANQAVRIEASLLRSRVLDMMGHHEAATEELNNAVILDKATLADADSDGNETEPRAMVHMALRYHHGYGVAQNSDMTEKLLTDASRSAPSPANLLAKIVAALDVRLLIAPFFLCGPFTAVKSAVAENRPHDLDGPWPIQCFYLRERVRVSVQLTEVECAEAAVKAAVHRCRAEPDTFLGIAFGVDCFDEQNNMRLGLQLALAQKSILSPAAPTSATVRPVIIKAQPRIWPPWSALYSLCIITGVFCRVVLASIMSFLDQKEAASFMMAFKAAAADDVVVANLKSFLSRYQLNSVAHVSDLLFAEIEMVPFLPLLTSDARLRRS